MSDCWYEVSNSNAQKEPRASDIAAVLQCCLECYLGTGVEVILVRRAMRVWLVGLLEITTVFREAFLVVF